MISLTFRRVCACAALLFGAASTLQAADAPAAHHILWSLQGKTNTVYLLGSIHALKESETLPAAIDTAYANAEALVMELDMDELDPSQMQQIAMELAVLPEGQSLQQQLGPETYRQFLASTREIGVDAALLDRFRPWFAALTLVQLQMTKMGLDPAAGVERRLTSRAVSDGKPIQGLETVREQLGILANLPDQEQRDFLLYSVEDAERTAREIDELLAAWRRGDTAAIAKLLAEGFKEYPQLYRPLTVERNRRWIGRIEQLLDDRDDYLVVVGALHLVGQDSVIDLLERRGHKAKQL
jgi:uncharacterized protein